jgi:hypothetical protein
MIPYLASLYLDGERIRGRYPKRVALAAIGRETGADGARLRSACQVDLRRDTDTSGSYAASLGLLRNMTIPSHMNHTI